MKLSGRFECLRAAVLQVPASIARDVESHSRLVRGSALSAERPLASRRKEDMTYKCAKCGKQMSRNVYFCSNEEWHLCWDCIQKAALTNKLTCFKCGKEVHRIDR